MGRRALRKIDPSLDLTGYLSTAEGLPDEWTSASLFDRDAPLEIEVGSGKGLFMVSASSACPAVNFLGIERSHKYARFAAARLARTGAKNAMMIHGDAVPLLRERARDGSIRAVHLYFPDPWWKKRHQKRRIMTRAFVQDIQRVLAPGGVLHFWTDVQDYFRISVELINQWTDLEGPHPVASRPAEHDLDYRTHFERRMRLCRQEVHRAQFHKRAPPSTSTAIVESHADH